MTIQETVGYALYRITHTRREGMRIDYGRPDWCSACQWFAPGLPVGISDGAWDDF